MRSVLLAMLIGLATMAAEPEEAPTRKVLDVPRVGEIFNYCGISAAAMVIEFYRGPIDQVALGQLAGGKRIEKRGVTLDELGKALTLFGIRSQTVNMAIQRNRLPDGRTRWIPAPPRDQIEGIKEELTRGHPVIVVRLEASGEFHAVVAIGYDDKRKLLYYNDPNEIERTQTVAYDQWGKQWNYTHEGKAFCIGLITRFDLTVGKANPDQLHPRRVDASGYTALIEGIAHANRQYLTGPFWEKPPLADGFKLVPKDFTREDLRNDFGDTQALSRKVLQSVFLNLLASKRPFLACGGKGRRGNYRLVVGVDPQAQLVWYYQGRQRWPAAESTADFADWWAFRPDHRTTLQVLILEPAKLSLPDEPAKD